MTWSLDYVNDCIKEPVPTGEAADSFIVALPRQGRKKRNRESFFSLYYPPSWWIYGARKGPERFTVTNLFSFCRYQKILRLWIERRRRCVFVIYLRRWFRLQLGRSLCSINKSHGRWCRRRSARNLLYPLRKPSHLLGSDYGCSRRWPPPPFRSERYCSLHLLYIGVISSSKVLSFFRLHALAESSGRVVGDQMGLYHFFPAPPAHNLFQSQIKRVT